MISSEQEQTRGDVLPSSSATSFVPLSFAQMRLWFLDQLEPNSSLYNIPTLAKIAGHLDSSVLERALNAIVARHEILRTRIVCQDEVPGQVISNSEKLDLRYVDQTEPPRGEEDWEATLQEEMRRPFDLSRDLLIRALLVKVSPNEHFLLVTMHHIISDEWSVQLFFQELHEFYSAFAENRAASLQELPIQYADFSIWQREWLQGEVLETQVSYWKDKLRNAPAPLELATDRARNNKGTSRAGNTSRFLGKALTESLKKMANHEGATLFMVLLAGFKALLHRYTGEDDIIVGSPIAGRNQVETEGLIGFFVNTLALRTDVKGRLTFRQLVQRVRETTLEAYAHQDLPFDKLVEQLHPERSTQHLHFTRVMFVLQQAMPDLEFSGLSFQFPPVVGEMSKFEITLAVQETSRGLIARAEFNSEIFDEATIAHLLEHFELMLKAMAAQPEQQLSQVPLLSQEEFQRIVFEWNQTATEYRRNLCVHEVFEAQADSTPEAVSITFNSQSLTYGELNARSNQLAAFLKALGVGPDVAVAICINRSPAMIIGLLAILKAGGAYVPLDATYPSERLALMLEDSGAAILLTEQNLISRLPRNVSKAICLDTDWELIAREPRRNLKCDATPENLAYIMYTSGSTGRPKGVAVPHRAINRLVLSTNYLQLNRGDRVAQVSNLSFDAATFEIWGALLNGGRLIGIQTDVALSPRDFAMELRDHGITAMFLTAALFNQLAAEAPGAFSTLRALIAGGEALDPKWTREVLRNAPPGKLLNGYGPTENTTFSCCHLITDVPDHATTVPIGKPIANTTVYLLDQYLNPVPVGVPGNLYVGGEGLARGYWNQPKLTSERFILNPFGPGVIYNTGDLARYLPDGNIEFLGRRDQQVKIRGFRIELGEIETALSQHNDIVECCVAAAPESTGDKKLIAYFVSANPESPNAKSLRRFLSEKLPSYMVPSAFVRLPRLPLTPNGKVDRKALPEPDRDRPDQEGHYSRPRDGVEQELVRIWEEILGVRPIGIEDRFFDLGGHSLLAVRLIAQIGKVFEKKVRLSTFFQAPTIAQIAALLRDETAQIEKTTISESLVEIQPRGSKPPVFLVHGAGGGMFWGYVNLARHLGNDQPVYGFRSRGLDDKPEFENLEAMAAQYINDLRSVQPNGPYHLGGYCFGGNVAFEMATQLAAAGEEIGLLALINCAPPNSAYGRVQYSLTWLWRFVRNLFYWAGYCAHWTGRQRREFFRWKLKMARKNLNAAIGIHNGRLDIENLVDLSSFSPEQQKLWEVHINAQLNYTPKPFTGKVHLFRSPGHPFWCSFEPKYGWGELAREGVEVTIVPAAHEKILEEPEVQRVAKGIQRIICGIKPRQTTAFEPSQIVETQRQTQKPADVKIVPLSFHQQRIWSLHQENAGAPLHHQVAAFRITGGLSKEALEEALNVTIERHEVLRTLYDTKDGQAVGRVIKAKLVLESIPLEVDTPDEERCDASALQKQISSLAEKQRREGFDLGNEIPIRGSLIELNVSEHILIVTVHEIAADKASMRLFLEEIAANYGAIARHTDACQPLGIQYADFAGLQKKADQEQAWEDHLGFFHQQLAGAPELLEFPASSPRPPQKGCRAATQKLVLPETLAQSITQARQTLMADELAFFGASVVGLLKRYVRQEQATVAALSDERDDPQFAESIGNFENLVLLPVNLSGDPLITDLVEQFRTTRDAVFAQPRVPFEKLLDYIGSTGDKSYHPLAQVLVSVDNADTLCAEARGVKISEFPLDSVLSKFDLHFQVIQGSGSLMLQVHYDVDLFGAEFMRQVIEHWRNLIEGITANPRARISQLKMLSPAEEHKLVGEFANTDHCYPREKTLVDMFIEQAGRTPKATALVIGNTRLTYEELYRCATIVSNRLLAAGVETEQLVGVCLERSWEMVAGILGTLQAGAAYVPMDPAYPKDRLEFMVQDAKMPVILTQRKMLDSFPHAEARIICIEDIVWTAKSLPFDPATDIRNQPKPEARNLAYVIYTSGSTGKPKGVAIEHRNAVSFVHWARSVFKDAELAGVLASTSICFDLSIFEMFVPLSWGGKVILAENALALPSLPAANEVTLINTVPSAIRELVRAKGIPFSVRVVNLAGEPLPTPLVEQIYSESKVEKVYDLYGPTETTTYSTFTLRKPKEPATIGRPLANEQVYILDAQRKLVPLGVPGELYIGGDGVARGYLGRPDLTAERFVAHPFLPESRVYRTGDLGRWRKDGNIEFLGRIDHQVKIRGFRIELGEVETAVKKQPGVTDAVVIAREDVPGNKRLVAYVVFTGNGRPAKLAGSNETRPVVDQLRGGLRLMIPEYMVPSVFVFLDAIPLTPNGKVDRKALPAPEMKGSSEDEHFEQRTALEEQLAGIWSEVLQIKKIGIQDNFFDLGGHSLLAFQIISRLRTALNVEVPFSGLFETPTIALLAKAIADGKWKLSQKVNAGPRPGPRGDNLPVSFVQERLWFLDQLNPGSPAYNVAMALRLNGPLSQSALQNAFNQVVERHEALRTSFRYNDGAVNQIIAPRMAIKVRVTEIRAGNGSQNQSRLEDLLNAEAQIPFDLGSGPLVRALLVRINETDHAFLVAMHHTVSDGWSLALFFRELEIFYRAEVQGSAPHVPELPVQYADFARWQREWMQGPLLDQEIEYWKSKLKGAPPGIDLPADKTEVSDGQAIAERRSIVLGHEVSQGIASLAHEGATPFITMLAALGITLRKWTNQSDMVIGTVVAGRNHQAVENVIGCFMNFLPVRIRINDAETLKEILRNVKGTVLEAQNHQDCPLEKMVEAINPERRSNQNPLYNVGLLLQNFPARIFQPESIQSSQLPINLKAALLDLRFEAEETEKGFRLSCEYKTELFEEKTVDELLASVARTMESLVSLPESTVKQLKVTDGLAGQAAARSLQSPAQTLTIAATFTAEPIEESIRYWTKKLKSPVKVVFAPYNQVFQQLLDPTSVLFANQRGLNVLLIRLEDWQKAGEHHGAEVSNANNIQRSIDEFVAALKTTKRSVPVLVCICPASNKVISNSALLGQFEKLESDLMTALQGIPGVHLISQSDFRALYPVIDYNDPAGEELGHVPYTPIMFDALGTILVRKLQALNRTPYKVIALDCDQTLWTGVCGEDGPEGVRLEAPRLALQQFMRAQKEAGMLLCLCSKNNEDDVWQVFQHHNQMPLSREDFVAFRLNWRSKPENLKALAEELKLGLDSFIFIDDNPVECAAVQDQCPEAVTLLLPEDAEQIPRFLNHCWAFDQVNSTSEDRSRTEMYAQNKKRQRVREQSVTLGDFLKGLDLKIQIEPLISDQLPRVAQLTQRTNQFNLTTRRRTENQIQDILQSSDILTVTVKDRFGDYGLVGVIIYRREKGVIDVDTFLLSCRVLGRGVEYRMLARLGEIARKNAIAWVDLHFTKSDKNKPALDFLEKVGANFRQPLNGGYLYRFPAGIAAGIHFDTESLEPASILAEESSPKPNKRVSGLQNFTRFGELALETMDVGAIHASIEAAAVRRALGNTNHVPPKTDLERQLCALWQKLLRVERVGIRDNFFELGGHSLLAVRLFAEIEKLTQRKLPLVTLFQAPTIEQLATMLGRDRTEAGTSLLVPIQPKGNKTPLFLVHGAGGDVLWGYANLAAHLPADQPVYGIKSRGQAGLEEWRTLEEMASGYLQEVRTMQPSGPYCLGGYCFGGNVAYEMARQLHAEGERVALLALLDSAPANAGYEDVTWWQPSYSYKFARNLYYWWNDFSQLDPKTRVRFVMRKARALSRKLLHRFRRGANQDGVDIEDVIDPVLFPENELNMWKIHLLALSEHVQKPYAGHAILFRTRGQPLFSSLEEDFCWRKLVKNGIEVKLVPGSHESVFVDPNVRHLAGELAAALDKTQAHPERESIFQERMAVDQSTHGLEPVSMNHDSD